MKPLPDIDDTAAMLLRGRRSALGKARREATAELRDAYTRMDSCRDFEGMVQHMEAMRVQLDRLGILCGLWTTLASGPPTYEPRLTPVGAGDVNTFSVG